MKRPLSEYTPTDAERRAIASGRAQIRRGDYVTLEQLNIELDNRARNIATKRSRTRA